MADITIENEKLQYENSELSVQLEKVESESKTYQEERDNLQVKLVKIFFLILILFQKTLDMINERQKSSKISSLLSIKKDQVNILELKIILFSVIFKKKRKKKKYLNLKEDFLFWKKLKLQLLEIKNQKNQLNHLIIQNLFKD